MTEEALAGIWVDDAGTTVLLFSEDGCRIVYPELELLGETASPFRLDKVPRPNPARPNPSQPAAPPAELTFEDKLKQFLSSSRLSAK